MHIKPPHCKRLQGAADAKRRSRRRTLVLQTPDNKADAVPCERLHRVLKNVMSAGKTRQNPAKRRSLYVINEYFESDFNTVWPSAIAIQQLVKARPKRYQL